MTSIRSRWDAPWFDMYAENARPAAGQDLTVPCAICTYTSRPGERVADLAGGRGLAHTACIGAQAARIGGRH